MFEIGATVLLWGFVLLMSEVLWRAGKLRGEYSRKSVHIIISISIALTPYYLSWNQIKLLGVIGLAGALLVRLSGIFKGAYDIKRKSWGDIIGPAAVLALVLIEPDPIIFAAVMLHTGVADGVAAIVGTRFGKTNSYKVFGYTKSVAGTSAFFATSLITTSGLILLTGAGSLTQLWPLLILLPISTTVIENIGVYGIDNALVTATTYLICSQYL